MDLQTIENVMTKFTVNNSSFLDKLISPFSRVDFEKIRTFLCMHSFPGLCCNN